MSCVFLYKSSSRLFLCLLINKKKPQMQKNMLCCIYSRWPSSLFSTNSKERATAQQRSLYFLHFPLTASQWLYKSQTHRPSTWWCTQFIHWKKKKKHSAEFVFLREADERRGNIHYIRLTSQQWECHNDEWDTGFKAGCLWSRYINSRMASKHSFSD